MDYEGMSREELLRVLRELGQALPPAASAELDVRRLLHELQVHQIELEMQNDALREAQGALEESRNRYADLYDYAPVAYCTLNEMGLVEELNLTASTLFGVPREQAKGRALSNLVRLEDPEGFWRHLGACRARQEAVRTELALTVQGRRVEAEAVSVPVVVAGEPGSARRFRTTFTDITRRKAAERAREQAHGSEQRLRQRLQALDALQIEVASHLTHHAGDALEELVEIITRHARGVMHVSAASLQLAFDADGAERAAEHSPPQLPQPEDASALHRLQLDLEYARQRLGTLTLLRAPLEQPFSEHDRETLAMFAARVASGLQIARLQWLQARESERLWLLERVGSELNSVHDQVGVNAALRHILDAACERFGDAGLLLLREETRLRLAHANVRGMEARAAAAYADPQLTAHVSAWLDARDDLQPQRFVFSEPAGLEAAEPSLARRVAQVLNATSLLLVPLQVRGQAIGLVCLGRTGGRCPFTLTEMSWCAEIALRCGLSLDNARLFEELRSAVDWRETLLATISHDLKSPLSAISLSASALVPEEPIPERRRTGRQVDLIRRSAEYMNNMINDLLFENMVASGGFQLELSRQSMAKLVIDACQMAEPLAAARGLLLEQHVENGLPEAEVDRERLLRVFSNLIGNASKFSPQGASIRVHARCCEAGVAFSVSDAGPGIAPEQQASLFKRYWRGAKGPRGLGLGLYIAKTIVEAHGGGISVSSVPGQGATFTFTIPLARP